LLVLGLSGCSLWETPPWQASEPVPSNDQPGYVYRPAIAGSGSYVTVYFPLENDDSVVVPVSRPVKAGEEVELVYAAVQELLAGPKAKGGLAPVAREAAEVRPTGTSIEDDQAYLLLSGPRPSDRLLTHIYLTLSEAGYRMVQVLWEQELLAELGSQSGPRPINVFSACAGLRSYLPVIATTDESYRLYLVPATVSGESTPGAAVAFVFSALQEGTNALEGTPLDGLVPQLFTEPAMVPAVRIDGATAIVDFTQDTVQSYQGGAAGEAALLDALTLTLTEFTAIDTVAYTIDGRTTERLFGTQGIQTSRQRPRFLNPE